MSTSSWKPNLFVDVGKSVSDLLAYDFPYDASKLIVKTTTKNGVIFTSEGTRTDVGAITSVLTGKYTYKNALFTGKVDTTGKVMGECSLTNLVDGLTLILTGTAVPMAKLCAQYKHKYFAVAAEADVAGQLEGSLTLGYEGVLVGASSAFDTKKNVLGKIHGVVAYTCPDFEVTSFCRDKGKEYGATYFHKVNPNTQVGGEMKHNKETDANLFTLVGYHRVDADTTLKAKLDSSGKIALSYGQALRKGVTLTLCAQADATRLSDQAHKFGLALAVE